MEEKTEIIEKFIKAKNGRATYKSWLLKYFKNINTNSNTYFKSGRDYDADMVVFAESIEGWAPATKKSAVSCVKNFLMYNDVELSPKTKYDLRERCKGPSAISQERVPTRKELKEILSFGTVKHKSLFLTMASSGMRPGEAVRISLDDIHLDENPVRIEIPYDITKTKESRTTYISSEAKHYLKQWLKIRKKYLESGRNTADITDKRIFPFDSQTLGDMWNGLTEKAGYDMLDTRNGHNRKRHQMTPNKLRKFFKTSLSNANIPFEVVEALMGHKEGMSAVYRRYSIDQLKDWYLKGESNLLIFEMPQNQEMIDDMKNRLDLLSKQMEEFIEFEHRVASTELRDEKGDVVLDENSNPVTVTGHIPQEVVRVAYEEEQKRKFQKLVETLGDESLAKVVWGLKPGRKQVKPKQS